jgi:hypothetical protein
MEREADITLKLCTGDEIIETTTEHPFYTQDGWKDAGDLTVSDTLQSKENGRKQINSIEYSYQKKKVFNFAVADWQTYFVGVWAWLVHNACENNIKKIVIENADKIKRTLLKKPTRRGNAPKFKKDGSSVEIHHKGQNPDGPYKEIHWKDHRGKGNDIPNHPNKKAPSKIDRKEWNKQRKEYWEKEYDNWDNI